MPDFDEQTIVLEKVKVLKRGGEGKKITLSASVSHSHIVRMSEEWRYNSTHLPTYPWGNSPKYRVARWLGAPRGRSARLAVRKSVPLPRNNSDCFVVEYLT
jgi:hypothetical protein